MNSLFKILVSKLRTPSFNIYRGRKHWLRPYLISLYKRRLEQGPEPERHRSQWINWNYNGELYCFGKRLSEEFDLKILQRAFITREYVNFENDNRKNILLDDTQLELDNQDDFIDHGDALLNKILHKLIINSFPNLPPDGHRCIVNHLMSVNILSHIGSNLGVKDLILYPTCPIPDNVISDTFKAIIFALDKSDSARTENFIKDFVMVQLIGKEIEDIWQITNPMGRLIDECQFRKMPLPEPRLLWATGKSTIMACYMVGIYSDKKFIGKGAGETLIIAEEMAARDCLNRFYGVTIKKDPLSYSDQKTFKNDNNDVVKYERRTSEL